MTERTLDPTADHISRLAAALADSRLVCCEQTVTAQP